MCSRMMDFLLYCGISRDDFNSIRNQLWKRNTRAVHIAVMLAGGIGALLLLINLIMRSSVIFPYLFLVCGSAAVSGLIELIRRKNAVNLNTIDRAAFYAKDFFIRRKRAGCLKQGALLVLCSDNKFLVQSEEVFHLIFFTKPAFLTGILDRNLPF